MILRKSINFLSLKGTMQMAVYEKPTRREGEIAPIECLTVTQRTPGKPVRYHYHEYTELLFGRHGRATVYAGSKRYLLSPGDLVIIHSHDPHDVVGADAGCYYTVIKFLPEILLSGAQTYSEYIYALLLMESMENKQIFFPAAELEGTGLEARFARLIEEWDGRQFGYQLSLRADVTAVFLYILRRWREKNQALTAAVQSGERGVLLQKAVAYVAANYADLTEERAAAACGVSACYFSRAFKAGMRQSFGSYVLSVRLREAKRLLLTSEDNVTEIAAALGFSSCAYFIARFRAATGETPLSFRRKQLRLPDPAGNLSD